MSKNSEAFEKATIKHIVTLYARIDALMGLVTLLARKQGADAVAVTDLLQNLETASNQRRFEELEQTAPAHAAELSGQAELSEECLHLLSQLEFDRDEEEG